jgi:hypothetical protein
MNHVLKDALLLLREQRENARERLRQTGEVITGEVRSLGDIAADVVQDGDPQAQSPA